MPFKTGDRVMYCPPADEEPEETELAGMFGTVLFADYGYGAPSDVTVSWDDYAPSMLVWQGMLCPVSYLQASASPAPPEYQAWQALYDEWIARWAAL